MKEIKKALQDRLEQQHLSQISIGAFLLHYVKKKSNNPEALTGHLKRNKLTLDLPPADDKTMRFIQRDELKEELNAKLQEFGYDVALKEIKIY